jgi:hypothetical protein
MAIQLILLKFQIYIFNEISPKLRHFFLVKKIVETCMSL